MYQLTYIIDEFVHRISPKVHIHVVWHNLNNNVLKYRTILIWWHMMIRSLFWYDGIWWLDHYSDMMAYADYITILIWWYMMIISLFWYDGIWWLYHYSDMMAYDGYITILIWWHMMIMSLFWWVDHHVDDIVVSAYNCVMSLVDTSHIIPSPPPWHLVSYHVVLLPVHILHLTLLPNMNESAMDLSTAF